MSTILAITGPDTHVPGEVVHADLLTPAQIEASERLPAGHRVVGLRGRTPIVRGPDGQLARMRSSGRLVKTGDVESPQSYLLVAG